MNLGLRKLVTAPVRLPVTVGEAKSHAKIDVEDDDALVDAWITEATQFVLDYCGRPLLTSTFDLYFSEFPCRFDTHCELAFPIPLAPIQSVTSVTYVDTAGAAQTWANTEYRIDSVSTPPRLVLGYGKVFPSYRWQSNSIVIRVVAGYGDNPGDAPEPLRNWIREQITYRNALRMRTLQGPNAALDLPPWQGISLLDPYRVYLA